jgi:SET domain-containing protein
VASDPAPIVVRRSGIDGRGVFATRPIKAGERIIEYAGERISRAEGNRRYSDLVVRGHPHTLLFELDARTFIDGGVNGNDARFINHSCRPNCEAVGWRGGIVVRALRRIRTGEELTYDYALPREKGLGAAEDRLYPCRCGVRGCRKTILEPLPRPRRRRRRRSG